MEPDPPHQRVRPNPPRQLVGPNSPHQLVRPNSRHQLFCQFQTKRIGCFLGKHCSFVKNTNKFPADPRAHAACPFRTPRTIFKSIPKLLQNATRTEHPTNAMTNACDTEMRIFHFCNANLRVVTVDVARTCTRLGTTRFAVKSQRRPCRQTQAVMTSLHRDSGCSAILAERQSLQCYSSIIAERQQKGAAPSLQMDSSCSAILASGALRTGVPSFLEWTLSTWSPGCGSRRPRKPTLEFQTK